MGTTDTDANTNSNDGSQLSRRRFLQVSLTAGGGLLVGAYVAGCSSDKPAARSRTTTTTGSGATKPPTSGAFTPNLFVHIDPANRVTLTVHRSEMGQGVRTALAMILAEELEVEWSAVHVVQSPANEAIGEQLTSGSGSVTGTYDSLRTAGAEARDVLVAAAAKGWGVEPAQCRARKGTVERVSTGEHRTYGELVAAAAALPTLRTTAKLKDPKDFRLIGTSVPRIDGPDIVKGAATYGIDVRIDGMLFATVARCPVSGGRRTAFDATAAERVRGVRDVVAITNGVAVVADSSWAAMQGRDALSVTWAEGAHAAFSTGSIRAAMNSVLQPLIAGEGKAPVASIEAVYETPYQAHVPMEPLSCVVDLRAKSCEVWAPTQNPQAVQSYVRDIVGVPTTVHVTMIGGGFGRRLEVDFAVEAAEVAKAIRKPVQVVWTRDDDLHHDYYMPPTRHWLRAGWDTSKALNLWRHHIVGPGLNGVIYQVGDEILTDGLGVPYNIADANSAQKGADIPLPTGPWRAVMDGPNAFANECFIDEVAVAVGKDPFQLRMDLLASSDPLRAVLQLAATKAGWGTPAPAGRARGIACHTRAETPVAMVAEVSASGGAVHVHKIVCAIDCGTVINPDMVVAQMQGGVAYALSAALKDAITFRSGRVEQNNFNDYRLLQLREMPVVEVHIVPSERAPQGVGEMGVPATAPAVANAIFALTQRRVRSLPIAAGSV